MSLRRRIAHPIALLAVALMSSAIGAMAAPRHALALKLPPIEVTVPSLGLPVPPVEVTVPRVEVTVPTVEASVAGVEASVPGTSVTVPGVTVTTPSAPAQQSEDPVGSGDPAGSGAGAGGGAQGQGEASGASGSSGAAGQSSESGAHSAAPPSAASAPPSAASSPDGASAGAGANAADRSGGSDPARPGAGRGAARHPGARGAVRSDASHSTATGSPAGFVQRTRGRRAAGRAHTASAAVPSGNPLEALGRHLPVPLPVPDWSKPIILLLLAIALALGVRARLAARRARRLEAQRATLLRDLHAMQAALVPDVPGNLREAGVSVAYRPADGAVAGGDFYDVFELESGRVGVLLGDVCGHGREALDRAALTRYTVRAYLQAELEPRAALALAGRALADPASYNFATVVAGVWDPADGRLTIASAGHPAPIVLGARRQIPLEVCCSPPLGWGIPTGRRQSRVPLPTGSSICFFTDGLTEARCTDGLLGSERLEDLLAGLGSQPQAGDLLARVGARALATPDDMAACIFSPRVAASTGSQIEELEVDRDGLAREELLRYLSDCLLPPAEVARVVVAAERLVKLHGAALLRVEFAEGGSSASVIAPERANAPGHRSAGEGIGVTLRRRSLAGV